MQICDVKKETIKQWLHDPCGYDRVREFSEQSEEFYCDNDEKRYSGDSWLPAALQWDQYSGRKVLEVGFGMGTDLFQFASAGAEVSGVDLSPRHLELARRRFSFFGLGADLQRADAENMPFDDGTFDLVYSIGVVHHTPDTQQALDEIRRVLKPGGRAVIAVYHKHSAFFWCHIVLSNFLMKGRFLRESFRRTKSRIEYRSHSDACPIVKVYSRRKLRRMLREFTATELDCRHLATSHFGNLAPFVSEESARKLENRYGWYLIAKCTK